MTEGKPPFIRNVEHRAEVKRNEKFHIVMHAEWPTPAWEFLDSATEIDLEKKELKLTYYGLRRAGVALQQITSFEYKFVTSLPNAGKWRLIIIGRGENWESDLDVI